MRQRNQNTRTPSAEPQDPANSLFLVKLAVSLGRGKLQGEKASLQVHSSNPVDCNEEEKRRPILQARMC